MMRVIAGTARGKNLAALPGEDVTRPTINRVKEAMFSSVQFSVPGARVLDLFAGSGQLGIEALSRVDHLSGLSESSAHDLNPPYFIVTHPNHFGLFKAQCTARHCADFAQV